MRQLESLGINPDQMPAVELFLAFVATTAVFAFVPGPAMLYAAAQTMARGRRSGLMAAFGIHVGGYVHVIAAAAGLSVLFHAVPVLYTTVKLAGAGYLIWLGFALLRAKPTGERAAPSFQSISGRRAFLDSIAVELLNPKTATFFFRSCSVRRFGGSISDLAAVPHSRRDRECDVLPTSLASCWPAQSLLD